MNENTSKVYVKTDSQTRIVQIEGEYTLSNIVDMKDWVLIEEGAPCDRLNLAQSQYFPNGLYTEDGIPRYKLVEGVVVERTQEEIEADRAAIPAPPPTAQEQLRADVDFLAALGGVEL